MKNRATFFIISLLLLAATLLLPSCIMAEERDFIRYDPATDEFRMLAILNDIQAKDAGDEEYLAGLYQNRDHWIMPVLPGGGNLFPLLAVSLIRAGDNEFSLLNIFSSRPSAFETTKTAVPLNTIEITAGQFFIEKGKLGYYQAYKVPGKTIDAALEEISKTAQADDSAQAIQEEIDRRTAGGKVYSWNDIQNQVTKNITVAALTSDTQPATEPATQSSTQPEEMPTPMMVLDDASLKALINAIKAKSLRITRQSSTLTLTLPLTAKDSAALIDLIHFTIRHAEKTFLDALASGKTINHETMQQGQAMLHFANSVLLTNDPNGIAFSVDLLKFTTTIEALPHKRLDLNSRDSTATAIAGPTTNPTDATTTAPANLDVAAYLQNKNIPLDQSLTTDQIIQQFNAGTLQSHPSLTPVKPGEGIISPPTTAPGM